MLSPTQNVPRISEARDRLIVRSLRHYAMQYGFLTRLCFDPEDGRDIILRTARRYNLSWFSS